MATQAAVAVGVLSNAISGTTDLTVSGFGTPTAAIIFTGNANSTNNPQDGLTAGVGFWTSSAQCAVGTHCAYGLGQTISLRADKTGDVIALPSDPTADTHFTRLSAAAITDGIRVTVNEDNTGVSRYVSAILINGTTNVKVEQYQLSTGTTYDITSTGFKPDLVFFATTGNNSASDRVAGEAIISFGVAHNNSSDTVSQGLVAASSVNSAFTSISNQYISNNKCVMQLYNDSASWTGAASAFDSSGFTLTTSASPGSDYIYYLALELADPDDGYVGVIDTATSTGNDAHTGVGFEPDVVGLAGGVCTAVNTVTAGYSLFTGVADSSRQRCLSSVDEDAQSTSDNSSEANLTNVLLAQFDTGADDAVASLNSLDSDGFTLNYSDPSASARKVLAFAIGDSTAGGAVTGDLAAQETGSDTAALTGSILVAGTLAVTETGADIAAFVGGAEVPVTGDLAVQEVGTDTAALTGSVQVLGDLAALESGLDDLAIAGSVHVSGTLAVTETGADIAAFVGGAEVPVTGDLAVQEVGTDTAALTGSVQVLGDLAALESGLDGLAIAGSVHVSGTLSVQETGQDDATIIGAGPVTVTGDLIAVEAGSDTGVILGTVKIAGTLSVQETGADAALISGSAPAISTGDLDATETGADSAVITGAVLIVGSISAIETGSDVARIFQRESALGDLAAVESGQDAASIAGLIVRDWDRHEQTTLDVVYSVHAKPAIYKVGATSVICQMVRSIYPQDEPIDAVPGVRGEHRSMRVRASEITEPVVGATIVYKGDTFSVAGYQAINEWEWQIDARA